MMAIRTQKAQSLLAWAGSNKETKEVLEGK